MKSLAALTSRRAPAAAAARVRRPRRADRFGLRDLLSESAAGIGARPGRLVLTILGTVLGIASVVVTVGLAQTAAGQINKQFDAVAATQAVAKSTTSRSWDGSERATSSLPWDAADRAEHPVGAVDDERRAPWIVRDDVVRRGLDSRTAEKAVEVAAGLAERDDRDLHAGA